MKKYDITPKPVIYDGVQFRSRTEAKWAYMFNEFKWKWQYEPYDQGEWWPDFKIYGDNELLIEVKPEIFVDDELVKKIINSGGNTSAIILFETIFDEAGIPFCGYEVMRKNAHEFDGALWSYHLKKYPDNTFDFGSWHGAYDGMLWDKEEFRKEWANYNEAKEMWNKAGNEVMHMKIKH